MIEVIYWSGTGNTEAMANALVAGIKEAGEEAHLTEVDAATPAQVESAEKIAFGCSAMGDEVLEEGSFEPFFASIEGSLKGKKVALFGSYGWGDGQWMRDWQQRVANAGATLFEEGLIVNGAPDEAAEAEISAFGNRFAKQTD